MELGALLRADPRFDKIDLGVGTYRDEAGKIPIMDVVKSAEGIVLAEQTSKGYLGINGDEEFLLCLQEALFPGLDNQLHGRLGRIQTPGGTGALRLALEIVAQANPHAEVWLGVPSWPAHLPLIHATGLAPRTYRYLDVNGKVDWTSVEMVLKQVRAGDVLMLHGCCHNPTGNDLPLETWQKIAKVAALNGVTVLVDLAYAGLGDGLEDDVAGVREVFAKCDNALVAVSCSKSFGLYRDRTGMLMLLGESPTITQNLVRTAASHARLLWSNPPDHGAAVVRTILNSPALTACWLQELKVMRMRINALREQLSNLQRPRLDLGSIKHQRGIFALLPLAADEVQELRERHGVYMDATGRINVSGLNASNFDRFSSALNAVVLT